MSLTTNFCDSSCCWKTLSRTSTRNANAFPRKNFSPKPPVPAMPLDSDRVDDAAAGDEKEVEVGDRAAEAHLRVRERVDQHGVEHQLAARLVLQHRERPFQLGTALRGQLGVRPRWPRPRSPRSCGTRTRGRRSRTCKAGRSRPSPAGRRRRRRTVSDDVVPPAQRQLVAVGLLEQPVAAGPLLALREQVGLHVLVDAGVAARRRVGLRGRFLRVVVASSARAARAPVAADSASGRHRRRRRSA